MAPPDVPPPPVRLELEGSHGDQHTDVLPIGADSSVLVYRDQLDRHEGNAEKHQFRKYDHALRLRWTTNVHLPAGTDCVALTADGTAPYALCTPPDERSLLVLRFDAKSGAGEVLHYRMPTSVMPLAFEVSGPNAFVVVRAYQQQTVLRLPLRDSAAGQFLSVLSGPAASVSDVAAEDGGATILTAERLRESGRLLLQRFSPDGMPTVGPWLLQGPYPATLTAARLAAPPAPDQPRLVVGTYATRDMRYAQGVFSCLLPPVPTETQPQILYYDLPTLPHYYDRYGRRHRERAATRAKRRREAGLETVARTRLLLHRPLRTPEGGYLLVAEQYYPRYRAGDQWYNRMYMSSLYPGYYRPMAPFAYGLPGYYGPYDPWNAWDRGPDGYVYTQALVCAFDAAGRLRWQQSFVLHQLNRSSLAEQVTVDLLPGNRLALAVPTDDGTGFYQTMIDANTPGPEKPSAQTPLPAQPATERVTDTRDVQVYAWCPGRLLVTGFQNISTRGKRARAVFFVNVVKAGE